MKLLTWPAAAGAMFCTGVASADEVPLAMFQDPASVYAPPEEQWDDTGINQGGVALDLRVSYFTDYVFRGIEILEVEAAEDRANLQIDGFLQFDLDKLPHPFFGVFVNASESDPESRFQEIRPYFGFDWRLHPLVVSAGHNGFIYPDRDRLNTTEIYGKVMFDDSSIFLTERPIFSPYFFAAYDYDNYKGWYFEAGVEHDFVMEEVGITLTSQAHVGYIRNVEPFSATGEDESGFQHYQLGLIAAYSLNQFFQAPPRYGHWDIVGYLYYTDGIDNDLLAETQVWGGGGIHFRY